MTFPEGIMWKAPNTTAPKWIKGQVFINVNKFKKWLEENKGLISERGWLNLDLKQPKDTAKGYYLAVNEFKPSDIKPDFPKDELPMPDFDNPKPSGGDELRPSDIPF